MRARPITLVVLVITAALAAITWHLAPLTNDGGLAVASTSTRQADLFNTVGTTAQLPVRGRIFEEPLEADTSHLAPLDVVGHDTLDDTMITLVLASPDGATRHTLSTVRTDEDGDLDHVLTLHDDLDIAPGTWRLLATLDGQTLGESTATLLPVEWDGLLVRADVDRTWLASEFDSSEQIVDLLRADAHQRHALPGMDVLLRRLRQGSGDAKVPGVAPLVFISGSPMIFQQTLEARAELDGLTVDGFVLKPLAIGVLGSLLGTSPQDLVPSMREQVGYKLYALLELREHMPVAARELLLGDDSEADHVVYALYHQFTAGTLDADALVAKLRTLDVDTLWIDRIASVAPRVRARLGDTPTPPPVLAIYVRDTGHTSEHHPFDTWVVPGVTRRHEGAWSLALSLYELGRFVEADVDAVRDRLVELGTSAAELEREARAAVDAGLLRADTVTRFDEK